MLQILIRMLNYQSFRLLYSFIIYGIVLTASILAQDGSKAGMENSIMEQCRDSRKCMCDYMCHKNKDCCDFIQNLNQSYIQKQPSDCLSTLQTISSGAIQQVGKYFTVTASCPNDSAIPQDLVVDCEASKLESKYVKDMIRVHENGFKWLRRNLKLIAPVIGIKERRIFGNINCAICNRVFGSYQRDISINRQIEHLIIPPLKVYCTKANEVDRACFVSPQLPEGFYRPCLIFQPRFTFDVNRLLGMDEIFLIPKDYIDSDHIDLPFDKTDGNRTFANSTIPREVSSSVNFWFQIIFSIFSIIGLSIMLFVYIKHAKLRKSLAGYLSMGLAVGLLVAQIAFILASIAVPSLGNRKFCVSVATVLLFSLLSSFTWMALFACQLLETFGNFQFCKKESFDSIFFSCTSSKREQSSGNATKLLYSRNYHDDDAISKFKKFLIAAISIPIILTLPALIINEYVYANFPTNKGNKTEQKIENRTSMPFLLDKMNPGICIDYERAWFGTQSGLLIWFLCPAAAMICFNMISLLIVSVQICLLSKNSTLPSSPGSLSAENRQKTSRSLAIICTKLSVILGASWFIQFFASWWPRLDVLRLVAALFNCAQGGAIALAMLLSSNTRRVLRKWICGSCSEHKCCKRNLIPRVSTDTCDVTASSKLSSRKVNTYFE